MLAAIHADRNNVLPIRRQNHSGNLLLPAKGQHLL
jgi:hypothetical protein